MTTKSQDFTPTQEQKTIVEKCAAGDSLKITAYAGTGKTSTLFLCAEAIPDKKILYICFDTESADRAKRKKVPNVTAMTFHAFVQRKFIASILANPNLGPSVVQSFKDRLTYPKGGRKLTDREIAEYLRVSTYEPLSYTKSRYLSYIESEPQDIETKNYSPAEQIRAVKKAISKFCNSSDEELSVSHFEKVNPSPNLFNLALAYWNDANNAFGRVPFTHDTYAKIWCLKNQTIEEEYGVMFIDEAQDTNPLQAQFYRNQPVQKIYVGDSRQAIYSFRGSVNELKKVSGCTDLSLTESFRFGPAIASAASNVYESAGENALPLVGKSKDSQLVTDEVKSPDVILVRKTVTMLDMLFFSESFGDRRLWFRSKMRDDLKNTLKTLNWFVENPKGSLFRPDFLTPELAVYDGLDDLVQAIKSGDEPPKTEKLLHLVMDTLDFDSLLATLKTFGGRRPPKGTYVEVMTAHKSKGDEWDVVQLADDFRMPVYSQYSEDTSDGPEMLYPPPEEELNIYYVAITRAKQSVGLGIAYDWIMD